MDKIDDTTILDNNKELRNEMFELPRATRVFIFILFFLILMVISIDIGAIAFSIIKFQKDLQFTSDDFTLYTSLGIASKIISSFIIMFLINIGNRKFLIVIFSFLHIPVLYPYIFLQKIYIFGAKVMNTFLKNFFSIYILVWSDQFGVRKLKPMMISLLGTAMLIGSTIGKYVSLYISWKFSMFIEMIAMPFIGIIFICINSDYFSKHIFSVDPKLLKKEEETHAFIVTAFRKVENGEIVNEVDEEDEEEYNEYHKNKKTDVSYIEDKNEMSSTNIFKFPSFFLWVISSSIASIPTGILGTFLHEYLEYVLNITDSDQRILIDTLTNIITFIVGISLGIILCMIVDGYDTIKARIIMVILYIILTVVSIFLTEMNTLLNFYIIYGIISLISSAFTPILTGIILTSVPRKLRGTATSLDSVIFGILGQLPMVYIYKLLKNYNEQDLRFPMRTSMKINFVAMVFYMITLIFEICKSKKPDKKKKEINNFKSFEIIKHADL